MWKVEEWCSTHREMVKGGMDDFRRMWDAKPGSYFREKTDNAKQWGVLEKRILSVKAAEKYVDCFYDLVGIYVPYCLYLSLLLFWVIHRYSVPRSVTLLSCEGESWAQEAWSDTQWYRGTSRICSQIPVSPKQYTTAVWAPELVPEKGAIRLQLKLSTSLPVPQNTQGHVWPKRFWLLLHACRAAAGVQCGAVISRNRWINTDL